MRTSLHAVLAVAFAAVLSVAATAQTVPVNFSGNTTGGPTWNRPSTVGNGTSGSCALSGIGTNVPYEVIEFSTNTTGPYVIGILGDSLPDTYLLLYQGGFDPADQCENLLALDDDEGALNISIIGAGSYSGPNPLVLTAGTSYYLVVTGFGNTDFGTYSGEIDGPPGAVITFGGTQPPVVDLEATVNTTSLPAGGGTLVFNVTVTNNTGQSQNLDLWISASGPASVTRLLGSGTLPAGASVTRQVRFRVPGGAPNGSYAVNLNVGSFSPQVILDTETFVITKGSPAPVVFEEVKDLAERAGDLSAYEALRAEQAAAAAAFVGALEATAEGGLFASAPAVSGVVGVAPNPFVNQTAISYEVAEAAPVRLAVYDVLGREVAVLVDAQVEAGAHSAVFDARGLAAGTYVYRLVIGTDVQTGRMTLTH